MKNLSALMAACVAALSMTMSSSAFAADKPAAESQKTSGQCTEDEQNGVVCKRKVSSIRKAHSFIQPGTPQDAPRDQICGWTCTTKCADGACIETCESKRPACKGKRPWTE